VNLINGSGPELWTWIDAAFGDLSVMITFLLERTGIDEVVLIMVGVSIVGHLYRILFQRGGISAGAEAVGGAFQDRGSKSDAEWAKLEANARKVNGWKG